MNLANLKPVVLISRYRDELVTIRENKSVFGPYNITRHLKEFAYKFGNSGELRYSIKLYNPHAAIEDVLMSVYRELFPNSLKVDYGAVNLVTPKLHILWGYEKDGKLVQASTVHSITIVNIDYKLRANDIISFDLIGVDDFSILSDTEDIGAVVAEINSEAFKRGDDYRLSYGVRSLITNLVQGEDSNTKVVFADELSESPLDDFNFLDRLVYFYVKEYATAGGNNREDTLDEIDDLLEENSALLSNMGNLINYPKDFKDSAIYFEAWKRVCGFIGINFSKGEDVYLIYGPHSLGFSNEQLADNKITKDEIAYTVLSNLVIDKFRDGDPTHSKFTFNIDNTTIECNTGEEYYGYFYAAYPYSEHTHLLEDAKNKFYSKHPDTKNLTYPGLVSLSESNSVPCLVVRTNIYSGVRDVVGKYNCTLFEDSKKKIKAYRAAIDKEYNEASAALIEKIREGERQIIFDELPWKTERFITTSTKTVEIKPKASIPSEKGKDRFTILSEFIDSLNSVNIEDTLTFHTVSRTQLEEYLDPKYIDSLIEDKDKKYGYVVIGSSESFSKISNSDGSKLSLFGTDYGSVPILSYGYPDSIVKNIDFNGDYRIVYKLSQAVQAGGLFDRINKNYQRTLLKDGKLQRLIKFTLESNILFTLVAEKRRNLEKFKREAEGVGIEKDSPLYTSIVADMRSQIRRLHKISTDYNGYAEEVLITDEALDYIIEVYSRKNLTNQTIIDSLGTITGLTHEDLKDFISLVADEYWRNIMFELGPDPNDSNRLVRIPRQSINIAGLALDKAIYKLEQSRQAWKVKLTTIGIPEMDMVIREVQSRNIILNVKVDSVSKRNHWLTGVYKVVGVAHQIDSNNGYLTTFDLIMNPLFVDDEKV